jgi:hypothetical protein
MQVSDVICWSALCHDVACMSVKQENLTQLTLVCSNSFWYAVATQLWQASQVLVKHQFNLDLRQTTTAFLSTALQAVIYNSYLPKYIIGLRSLTCCYKFMDEEWCLLGYYAVWLL